jgi:hypothetical protein
VPRGIDSTTQTVIASNAIRIAFFLQINFKSEISYLSTLPCNIAWNGHTWLGVGSLGTISPVTEGTDIQAYGTSVTLSGIDASLLTESMTDIQLGAPAILYMVLFDGTGTILGTPTIVFSGQVDKPSVTAGPDTISITLNLESEMINLQRGQMRRLTNADQHIDFPTDTAFTWVPLLNFMALKWGTA